MAANLAGKRVLVLSDNEGLFRAIALNLESYLGVEVVRPAPDPGRHERQAGGNNVDLITVAMSALNSEPIVALTKASLIEQIGRVPLLIISDRPFQSGPDDKIVHLDFPFDIDALHHKVREILEETAGS